MRYSTGLDPTRAPTFTAGSAALAAAWLGLVVGLAELPLLALRRWGLGIPLYLTPQVVWAAPLTYVVFFLPVALAFVLLARRWPVVGTPAVLVFPAVAFGSYSALQVFRIELHDVARMMLAAGIAWRSAASARRDPDGLRRLARRTIPLQVLIVAALTATVNLAPVVQERRALAGLPSPRPAAPNVLLLILDTMRAATMSLYGHRRPTTPNLERLAADGIVFERAVVTSPWSSPSHAGIFTGHFPHQVPSGWEKGLDGSYPTIAEAALLAGYRTGGFSANTRYVSRQTGMARGFARFDDFSVLSLTGALAATWAGRLIVERGRFIPRLLGSRDVPGRKRARDVLEPLLAWIARDDDRPFFAMANLMDVHAPYLPPDPYASRFGAVPLPNLRHRVTARVRQAFGAGSPGFPLGSERQGYEGAVAHLDHQFAAFLGELERRGVLRHTAVILTSDHGEEFEEETGFRGHGVNLCWIATHVPLVVWLPDRQAAGMRVREPVTLRAIPATVADLLGLEPNPFPGTSLARAWDGTGRVGDTVLAELPQAAPVRSRGYPNGPMRALVVDSLHYIRYGDGSEQLFDIVTDPWEREDLAPGADAATLDRFRAMLKASSVEGRNRE